jgi:hypothetical protein
MFNINDKPIKWKGQTYNQIISTIKRNNNSNLSAQNTFLPNPCKIYRRELTTPFSNSGNERTSLKINEILHGTSQTSTNTCNNLIIQTEYLAPSDTTLKGDITNSTVNNSIRRVRSSGMNNEKPVFISNTKIGTKYYTNETQYLKSISTDKCTIYNPNNTQFSQQGAVSNSNYILRKSFDINRTNNDITTATYLLPLSYAETIKNNIGDTGTLCSKNIPH